MDIVCDDLTVNDSFNGCILFANRDTQVVVLQPEKLVTTLDVRGKNNVPLSNIALGEEVYLHLRFYSEFFRNSKFYSVSFIENINILMSCMFQHFYQYHIQRKRNPMLIVFHLYIMWM